MSSEVAIRVDGLSKCYQIYDSPRDRLKQFIAPRLKQALGLKPTQYYRDFWALRDISFEIRKGETVGIIGRNGSGKSTLLQIICGTLNPSSGTIHTSGRIAALLELGSGFNPEFSGRENVYLNATVLGLSRSEIDARFDDICAFADIGDFIDQPVKTYSSGMYVRLAFAVIAHVDADILVVDEALSVGDAIFTQKCMRFIRRFQQHGTLLFVSHDTAAVQNLCETAIWLNNGQIAMQGASRDVAESYLQFTLQEMYGSDAELVSIASDDLAADASDNRQAPMATSEASVQWSYDSAFEVFDNLSSAKGWKTGKADIEAVSLTRVSDGFSQVFEGGERVRMSIRVKAHEALARPIVGFLVRDRLGQDLFGENTLPFTLHNTVSVEAGETFEGIFEFRLPMLPNGQYVVMVSVADGDIHENVQHHWLHDALVVSVSSSKVRYGLVGTPFEHVELKIKHE